MQEKNQIVSLSGGKDSTAMLLMMLERGENIHSAVFFDTGWEFDEMYEHLNRIEEITGIKIVRLKHHLGFEELLKRYRWPDPLRRWCTAAKRDTIKAYVRRIESPVECIGISASEVGRIKDDPKRNLRYPLIEYGITGEMALSYCYKKGFTWGGLYKEFPRVGCFCCFFQNHSQLKTLRELKPKIWSRMLEMDRMVLENSNYKTKTGFKGYETVEDLEKRFVEEQRWKKLPLN